MSDPESVKHENKFVALMAKNKLVQRKPHIDAAVDCLDRQL